MRTIAVAPLLVVLLFGLVACGGGKSSQNQAQGQAQSGGAASPAGSMAPMEAASASAGGATPPDCGAVQAVWVNLNTKVYHLPSDPLYGKTKHGEYLCPAQAKAQGFHPAGGAHHHKKSYE